MGGAARGIREGRGGRRRLPGLRPGGGRRALPGGVVDETPSWVVNHVVGPMNVSTLVVGRRGGARLGGAAGRRAGGAAVR
ncbi:hypothetical protein LZG04_06310 [Saccharothrix sp. S26]|uniref:hypothetical protein n=1 Tax=Saccharothrix sp. S26 TaxID=2907215 RepID=UPI001F42926D|nr:hypothetical protein [Saccharothrix sp. S26]MCE6994421.1 hypothetical protein [Saccharothrix sp. S26]